MCMHSLAIHKETLLIHDTDTQRTTIQTQAMGKIITKADNSTLTFSPRILLTVRQE